MTNVEVEVLRPMWVDGRPRGVGEVVSMPRSEADYAIHLGRAAAVVEEPAQPEAPPAKPKKAKAGDGQ
jgi:hypothetical protein